MLFLTVSRGPTCAEYNESWEDDPLEDEKYNFVIAWKEWIMKMMKHFDEKEDTSCNQGRKLIKDPIEKDLDGKIFLQRVASNFKRKS